MTALIPNDSENQAATSGATSKAIAVDALTHRYPAAPRAALDAVSFEVMQGETFGILGPNGSGKTTLFRILATMLGPTGGDVHVFGADVETEPTAVRRQLGVVFQSPSLDDRLSAVENMTHHGHLYGLRGKALRQRIDELLAAFGLAERGGEPIARFSGGMRRKVEIAKAVLHEPRLLLLDEPSTGLDPAAQRDMWELLRQLQAEQGITISLTTHLMHEAEHCDRLAILDRGKLIAMDTPTKLKDRVAGETVVIHPAATDRTSLEALQDEVTNTFGPWEDGGEPKLVGGELHLNRDDGVSLIEPLMKSLGQRARGITLGRPTLETVFLQLTGHQLSEDQDANASLR